MTALLTALTLAGARMTFNIAIVGAQASGKTQLARELTQAQPNKPPHATPNSHGHGHARFTFSDAPPSMAALLAHLHHPPATPLPTALAAHQHFDFTLVCGLDLRPQDGPETPATPETQRMQTKQEAQDTALRTLLSHAKLPFAVIYGQGRERLSAAQRALGAFSQARLAPAPKPRTRWHATCENCSDSACERALFTALLKNPPY